MRCIKLGDAYIGDSYPVYIIAEIGGNFINFEQAKKLIYLAIDTGANAVKLQTYRAETISSRSAMYNMPNTGNVSQFDLFKKYEIGFDLHRAIWDYCRKKGIIEKWKLSWCPQIEFFLSFKKSLQCGKSNYQKTKPQRRQ